MMLHCIINYQKERSKMPCWLMVLSYWREASETKSDCRDFPTTSHRNCWRRRFADVIAIQLVLDIAEWEKWPAFYLYTDSWILANTLWEWLQWWKQNNWQYYHCGIDTAVARHWCLGGDPGFENTSCRFSSLQELSHWRKSE